MSSFNIGDTVSTKTHPFFKDITNIKIAGDPINVIPLMVVIEVYNETRTTFNEETGEEITRKGTGKCKCIWFSLKVNSFNDAWFDFEALKKIENREGIVVEKKGSDIEFKKNVLKNYLNRGVLFKTAHLELKKVKETKIHDNSLNKISDYSSLLNFVSPPLHIVDVKTTDDKGTARFDSKTGNFKRISSVLSFKCRYYNASADKWSEVFIPSEALIGIEDVSSFIKLIESDRKKKKFYVYDYTQEVDYDEIEKESTTILEIDSITYLNGFYSLKTYDLIHQEWKILDIPFDMKNALTKNNIFSKKSIYPNFDFKRGSKAPDKDRLLADFSAFVDKHEEKKNSRYLLINYLNNSGNTVQRVIRDFFVVPASTKKANTYLHGFCCKKREVRSFNFKNIRSVKLIKSNFTETIT